MLYQGRLCRLKSGNLELSHTLFCTKEDYVTWDQFQSATSLTEWSDSSAIVWTRIHSLEIGLDASNFEYTFNTFNFFIHRSPNHSFRYQFRHSPRDLRLSELRINTVGLKQQISQPAVFSYMIWQFCGLGLLTPLTPGIAYVPWLFLLPVSTFFQWTIEGGDSEFAVYSANYKGIFEGP